MTAASVVVDDHLLLSILLEEEPAELRSTGARIFSTGLWYHRLCRALGNSAVVGTFERALSETEPAVATTAIKAVTRLPESIELLSMRELAWPMARLLDDGVRLNLLSLEALAAAEHVEAELCLAAADTNPPLAEAAQARGRPCRIIGRRRSARRS